MKKIVNLFGLTLLLVAGTLVVGCSGGKEGNAEVEEGESNETVATKETTGTPDASEALVSAANDGLNPVITHTALMETTAGTIELELYGVDAPKTVANFVGLAEKDFYNGIRFHRVMKGFMIQTGDPKSKDPAMRGEWGTGGESIYGATFVDELDPLAPSYKRGYKRGAMAMANRGPNTNSSQFFILHADYPLPHAYTLFGYVRSGIETIDAIVAKDATAGGKPAADPTQILSIKVTEHQAINAGS